MKKEGKTFKNKSSTKEILWLLGTKNYIVHQYSEGTITRTENKSKITLYIDLICNTSVMCSTMIRVLCASQKNACTCSQLS